VRIADHGPC